MLGLAVPEHLEHSLEHTGARSVFVEFVPREEDVQDTLGGVPRRETSAGAAWEPSRCREAVPRKGASRSRTEGQKRGGDRFQCLPKTICT